VGIGLLWLLVIVVLLLGAAALVKYLRSERREQRLTERTILASIEEPRE
jgi:cytochrome c-type biogenesis protein CcmH/NrfF